MAGIKHSRPAAAAFFLMMAMSLTTTGLSFFVEPVCGELGLSRGSFTVYYSLMTAAGTLAAPFLGQLVQRRGVGSVAVVSGFWVAAGLFGFSLCENLQMFWLIGGLMGILGTACVTLCAGVLVQTHYRGSEASRLTGIVMAGSGLGGMIVSAFLPELMAGLGWRVCYRLVAAAWLTLLLCAALLLWGTAQANRAGERAADSAGMTRAEALRSGKLRLLIGTIFLLSAASGVQQQLPAVLSEAGLDTNRMRLGMSVFTAALALGKIFQGLLYGRIGAARGGFAMVLLYIGGFALLGMGQVWPGLVTLAAGMGTVTTLMPIVTRAVFGNREYAAIWGILSAVSNLGAMIAAPLFGMAFDVTGSYGGAMRIAAVLLIPALAGLVAVFYRRKNV